MRLWILLGGALAFGCGFVVAGPVARAQHPLTGADRSARELYNRACAACHASDGTGNPVSTVGFDVPLPDFTDCRFASREADGDWLAVVHQGGPVRAFDRFWCRQPTGIGDNGIWRIAKRNGILYLPDVGSKTTSFFSASAGISASS